MKMRNVIKGIQWGAIFLLTSVALVDVISAQQTTVDVQKPLTTTKADVEVGNFTAVDTGDIKVKKVAVGDVDEVWVASEGGKIYQLTSQGWQFRTMGIDVGVAEDGTVVVINEKNDVVMRNEEGEWTPIADFKLTSIAVGCADGFWGVYKEGENVSVYHFDDGKWEKVKNTLGQDAKGLVYFSVNAEEVVYAIDDKGNIYRRDLDRVALVEKTKDLREKISREKKAKPVTNQPVMSSHGKSQRATAASARKQATKKSVTRKPALRKPVKKSSDKSVTVKAVEAAPMGDVKVSVTPVTESAAPAATVVAPVMVPVEVSPAVAEEKSAVVETKTVEPATVSTAAPMD